MRKKLFSIIFSLTMVLAMIPAIGSVVYAAEKPLPAQNVHWDGNVCSWENPNGSNVSDTFLYLYNKEDPSTYASAAGMSSSMTSYDLSNILIPGQTYYFTIYFRGLDGTYGDQVASDEYTVPGSFTKSDIPNVVLQSNGNLTWDAGNYYQTQYKSVLYVKEEESWVQLSEARGISYVSDSYSWKYKIEEGKTYKATLVGLQGSTETTKVTESNEMSAPTLTKLSSPGDLDMYGGVCEWTPVDDAKGEYSVIVYNEDRSSVAACSGYFDDNGIRLCTFDAAQWLTVGKKYYFTVVANGDNFAFKDSDVSTSDVFEYKGSWNNLHWDGKVAKWDAFDGASSYWVTIYKNGEIVGSNGFESDDSGTSYDASEKMTQYGEGEYQFRVAPRISNKWRSDLTSDLSSAKYTYTAPPATLDTPSNLRWNGYVAEWDAVSDASSYTVQLYRNGSIAGQPLDAGDTTSIRLRASMQGGSSGEYTFSVQARNGEEISDWSPISTASCEYTEIDKPANPSWSGTTATWDVVQDAKTYWIKVFKDDKYSSVREDVVYTNHYDISELVETEGAGNYSFEVCAGVQESGGILYGRYSSRSAAQSLPCVDHVFDMVVDKKATASEDGLLTKTCTKCNATETVKIRRIGSVKLSTTSYTYNGSVKSPSLTVKDINGNTLVKGTDYTVTVPSGRKNVGTYTYKITFKGNYSGTKSLSITINPGSAAIKPIIPGSKKMTVKMTTKPSSKGASTYQIYYKQKGTSTWKKTTTTSYYKTIKSLKKGKYYYVKVRAYKKVGTTTYYGAWSATKLSKKIK